MVVSTSLKEVHFHQHTTAVLGSGAEFDSCGALVFVKAEAREAIRQIEKLKAHQAP